LQISAIPSTLICLFGLFGLFGLFVQFVCSVCLFSLFVGWLVVWYFVGAVSIFFLHCCLVWILLLILIVTYFSVINVDSCGQLFSNPENVTFIIGELVCNSSTTYCLGIEQGTNITIQGGIEPIITYVKTDDLTVVMMG
jgi:hypothetical protein